MEGQGTVTPLEVLLRGSHSSEYDDLGDVQYPVQGPAYDSDKGLDLLARIGLRLSRGLLAQPQEEQDQLLSALGLGR